MMSASMQTLESGADLVSHRLGWSGRGIAVDDASPLACPPRRLRMSRQLLFAGVMSVLTLSFFASGCSNASLEPQSNVASTGTLELPLTAESGGVKYRLNKARFTIKGVDVNFSRVITPPANVPVAQETLPAGAYQIWLENGWQLEQMAPGDPGFTSVEAQLNVPNPQSFKVQGGKSVDVVFSFVTPGGAVKLRLGRANVRISVQDCATFDAYAASIATYTVDCLGRIDQYSYVVDGEGFLRRNFDECPLDASVLQSIDDFLGLQYPRELPAVLGNPLAYSKECIAGRWMEWREQFDATGIGECPEWTKLSEINTPTPEAYDEIAKLLPPLPYAESGARPTVLAQLKVNAVYAVSFPAGVPSACDAPGSCAAECAAGFPGFVIAQDGDIVITDPPTWQKDTMYADVNPYTRPGYYHPMSLYGALPGEIFSHVNRSAPTQELCSYYDGGFHIQTPLVKNCAPMPDGTESCVGVCAPSLLF
jgi:hypothetical protein